MEITTFENTNPIKNSGVFLKTNPDGSVYLIENNTLFQLGHVSGVVPVSHGCAVNPEPGFRPLSPLSVVLILGVIIILIGIIMDIKYNPK